jgi:ribosomal protein L11 methylase PrmA
LNYSDIEKSPASFRDPSGFIFLRNRRIHRAVGYSYKKDYEFLISSGLYNRLTADNLLIKHQEIDHSELNSPDIYKVLQPTHIKFISYPYEWSFSQLMDAALTTLRIQRISLEYEMILKDASAFNIQFQDGIPVFIDTLSFEKYIMGKPWVAYRQFCMHFLAPLLLMKYNDLRMNRLLSLFIDGIPLDLARNLLPGKSFFKLSNFSHIYLHSLSEKHSTLYKNKRDIKITKIGLFALIDNLEKSILGLKLKIKNSTWGNYYLENSYTPIEIEHKKKIVEEYINEVNPSTMIDFGANTGLFSRISSSKNIYTISTDFDPYCVELNYLEAKQKREKNILPLYLDLTNPSSDLGWNSMERNSFLKRIRVDTIMALALSHHLSITNNVPFDELVHCFSQLSDNLIIEFVPKQDIQVKSLLVNRKDIYDNYNLEYFEKVFMKSYNILKKETVTASGRTLYLMKLRQGS